MAKEALTLTVEADMDDAGRGRAASVFLLLATTPEQVADFLDGHDSLAEVQEARDALSKQKELAAAARDKTTDGATPEVTAPRPYRLYVARCVTALLEHCDMLNVDLDAATSETTRSAVARGVAAARADGRNFDAGVTQLRAIAGLATQRPLIVAGLPEFDRHVLPGAVPPLAV